MSVTAQLQQQLGTVAVPSRERLAVVGWLEFVRDWGQVDVRSLLKEVAVDPDLHDAIAAVIETGKNAWEAFDAVRTFCVQRLFGAERLDHEDTFRPLAGVSPFSVPVELIKSCFALQDREFQPHQLGTKTVFKKLTIGGGTTTSMSEHVPQDQLWLMTTMWARLFPPTAKPMWADIELGQLGANRFFKHSLLGALARPQPLFLFFHPNDSFQITVRDVQLDEPVELFVFVEGWTYSARQ